MTTLKGPNSLFALLAYSHKAKAGANAKKNQGTSKNDQRNFSLSLPLMLDVNGP